MTESTSVLPDVLNRSTRLSVFCWKSDIRGDWTFALGGLTLCADRIGNHNAYTQISFPKNGTKPPLRPMIPMPPPDGVRRGNGRARLVGKVAARARPVRQQSELYGWRKVAWLVRESRTRKFLQVLLNNCEIMGNRFFFARIGANAKNTSGFFSSVADENRVDSKLLVARFTADKQKPFLWKLPEMLAY